MASDIERAIEHELSGGPGSPDNRRKLLGNALVIIREQQAVIDQAADEIERLRKGDVEREARAFPWVDALQLVEAATSAAKWIEETRKLSREVGTLSSLAGDRSIAPVKRGLAEQSSLRRAATKLASQATLTTPNDTSVRGLVEAFAREAARYTDATPDEMPMRTECITQPGWDYSFMMGDLRRLAALTSKQTVSVDREGWVLVPRKPTALMEAEASSYMGEEWNNYESRCELARLAWSAMLASAPPLDGENAK